MYLFNRSQRPISGYDEFYGHGYNLNALVSVPTEPCVTTKQLLKLESSFLMSYDQNKMGVVIFKFIALILIY